MITILNTQCNSEGSIRASCHHDVTNKLALCISIKDITIDYSAERFVNCVCYMVVCFPCFLYYLLHGCVLLTKRSEQRYMKQDQ